MFSFPVGQNEIPYLTSSPTQLSCPCFCKISCETHFSYKKIGISHAYFWYNSTLCQSGFYTLYPVLILTINKLDLMESKITEKDTLQQEGMWGVNFPHIAVTAVGKVGMKSVGTEGRWQLIRW